MRSTLKLDGIDEIVMCGGSRLRTWQPEASPPLTGLKGDQSDLEVVPFDDIATAIGLTKNTKPEKIFGDYLELVDPEAIFKKADGAREQADMLRRQQLPTAEKRAEDVAKAESDAEELARVAAQAGPRVPAPADWLSDDWKITETAYKTLGLQPGGTREAFLAALKKRAEGPIGIALRKFSASYYLKGLARATRGERVETLAALGAFKLPGMKVITLGSEAKPQAEQSNLTGLQRAIAAAKQEHTKQKEADKLKPKPVTLSAAHSHLIGIDRAIAAHKLNPDH